jgi:MFS family permease
MGSIGGISAAITLIEGVSVAQLFAVALNRQFQSIACTQLLTVISSNLFVPILPVYLKLQSYSDAQIGLVMGATAMGALVMRPWAGRSIDTQGSHPVVLGGQALFGLCLMGYLAIHTFIPMVILRLLHGIAIAFYGTASITFASCVETPNNTSGAIALYSVFTMVGLGAATSAGPLLFDVLGFHATVGISLAALLMAASVMIMRAEPIFPCIDVKPVPFLTVLQSKSVFAPAVCLFASNFAFGMACTFIPLIALEQKIASYSVFYMAFAVAVVGARLAVQYINERWRVEQTATIASLLNACSMLLIAVQTSVTTFAISGMLIGLGFGIVYPSLAGYVVNNSNPANKGTALGVLSGSGDVGAALGAAVLGMVAELYGYRVLFFGTTGVVLLCTYYFYAALGRSTNSRVRIYGKL